MDSWRRKERTRSESRPRERRKPKLRRRERRELQFISDENTNSDSISDIIIVSSRLDCTHLEGDSMCIFSITRENQDQASRTFLKRECDCQRTFQISPAFLSCLHHFFEPNSQANFVKSSSMILKLLKKSAPSVGITS